MSGLIHSFPAEAKASPKIYARRDTSENCRERASADLLKSVTMMTANERLILERSAASWSVRAALLERVEGTARERDAASGVQASVAGEPSREQIGAPAANLAGALTPPA